MNIRRRGPVPGKHVVRYEALAPGRMQRQALQDGCDSRRDTDVPERRFVPRLRSVIEYAG